MTNLEIDQDQKPSTRSLEGRIGPKNDVTEVEADVVKDENENDEVYSQPIFWKSKRPVLNERSFLAFSMGSAVVSFF
jgi:hypothetical protein